MYQLDWKHLGKRKKSTFFPSDWTRQEVVKKIKEAEKYIQKYKINFEKQSYGKNYEAIGFTKEGIRIKFIQSGQQSLITVFPDF